MAMTPPPDYLRAECRAAAKELARVVRRELAKRPGDRVTDSAIETLECNLVRYFLGCCESGHDDFGLESHRFGGGVLRLVFPGSRRYLRPLDWVVIEPGRVTVLCNGLVWHGAPAEWSDVPGTEVGA
jgi:hypothetical protein